MSKLVSPQDALRQKLEARSWKLGKYGLRVSRASIDTSIDNLKRKTALYALYTLRHFPASVFCPLHLSVLSLSQGAMRFRDTTLNLRNTAEKWLCSWFVKKKQKKKLYAAFSKSISIHTASDARGQYLIKSKKSVRNNYLNQF